MDLFARIHFIASQRDFPIRGAQINIRPYETPFKERAESLAMGICSLTGQMPRSRIKFTICLIRDVVGTQAHPWHVYSFLAFEFST
jgi:hypothetical protein